MPDYVEPPELQSRVDATQSSVVEGVDAAISAWVANKCNRVSGQEVSEGEAKLHGGLARGAKLKELDA